MAASVPLAEAAATESAAEAADDVKYADKTEAAWTECEAKVLETTLGTVDELGGCPIRLLDARFLIALAKAGGMLDRRQALPEGAFFDLPRLKRESWGFGGASLRVLIVLMPHLQLDHPDPKGAQLRSLAAILESFVADDGGSYAVYLSYCSLLQPGPDGEPRTPTEARLCELALKGLTDLYSHPATWLLEMTSLPSDFPEAYDLDDGVLPAGFPPATPFMERGWHYAESMATKLSKNATMILDCGKFVEGDDEAPFLEDVVDDCKGSRPPPLTIDDFRATLATKAFMRPADYEVACAMYTSCFEDKFRPSQELVYDKLGWGDEEVVALCKVLECEVLPQCKQLWCSHNSIGDAGMSRIAAMLHSGAVDALETLNLYGNPQASEKVKDEVREARPGIEVFFSPKNTSVNDLT